MKYGLWDTNPGGNPGWLGNPDHEGPLEYEDSALARVAAITIEKQMGWKHGRVRVMEYVKLEKPRKAVMDTRMTALEAIQALEEGR